MTQDQKEMLKALETLLRECQEGLITDDTGLRRGGGRSVHAASTGRNTGLVSLLGTFNRPIFPDVSDLSDFLGRLHPRRTRLQKPRTDLRLG